MIAHGMPTLLKLPDIADCAALCRALKLQFVELNMCLPQYQADVLDVGRLGALAESSGIFYTIHLDDTNTPCDFNARIAGAYTDTVLATIDIAKQLHIPILNMHLSLGTYFTLPEKKVYLFEEYKDVYFSNLKLFRDRCEKAIGSADIKITVENTRAFSHPLGQESLALLFESPAFALTFDTGHDASNRFAQRPIIDRHIDRLVHMHLHDTLIETRQDHLPLGDGELALDPYLTLSETHHCRVVVEVKTIEGLKKSTEWLNRRSLT